MLPGSGAGAAAPAPWVLLLRGANDVLDEAATHARQAGDAVDALLGVGEVDDDQIQVQDLDQRADRELAVGLGHVRVDEGDALGADGGSYRRTDWG